VSARKKIGPKNALRERIDTQSRESISLISEQLRSPLGVLPFVGAGFSAPFKFPEWGALLRELARTIPRGARALVDTAVEHEEYTRAAAVITRHFNETTFQRELALRFPNERFEKVQLCDTGVELVPHLTSGLVITTNFDGVLEYVFESAGARFSNDAVVCGANPTQVMPAIQQNRWMLWKIHGDRNDPRTRVLSAKDYKTHYRQLKHLLALALSNRPALFLGCSLEKDRTVGVLRDVQRLHPGLTHFALLEAPETEAALDRRVADLRALGIRPIWFRNPDGRFAEIRQRLLDLVQRSSTRPARTPPGFNPPKRLPIGPHAASDAAVALSIELADLQDGVALENRISHDHNEPMSPEDTPPFAAIADRIAQGEVVFFLGAGALLGRLPLAREFYEQLRTLVEAPKELSNERVTQHYVDFNDRHGLDSKLRALLDGKPVGPTALHWLLGTLTGDLRSKGYKLRAPLIMTTNFDQTMERVFEYSGQRYHLFTYRLVSPHEGHFVYRTPDGELLAVDRPERFRHELEDCPVMVKYHGGLHHEDPLPLTYAVTECDFVHTARNLPKALPRVVLDRILGSALLFLGTSLRTQCVEALVRQVHRARPHQRSWAVQRSPAPGWPLYWRGIGVDILDVRLQRFVIDLAAELKKLPERRG
jgi:hypothetical protein